MSKKTDQKLYPQHRLIDLPMNIFGLSHVKNIEYCIEQLKAYPKKEENPVFGYFLVKGPGLRPTLNQISSEKRAEKLAEEHKNFRYHTLDNLLKKKEDILDGRYEMSNGLIIRLNPVYFP